MMGRCKSSSYGCSTSNKSKKLKCHVRDAPGYQFTVLVQTELDRGTPDFNPVQACHMAHICHCSRRADVHAGVGKEFHAGLPDLGLDTP